jgi:PEGA domain
MSLDSSLNRRFSSNQSILETSVSRYSDSPSQPAQASRALASWYAPGVSDELGDRLLMFDNSNAPSLELLRFRRALTATPGFELALRRRVERLSDFRHPSFVTVRSIEYLGHGHGPALLSNYTPGKRLSELLQEVRGPEFAAALIQQLDPALASLRQHGEGIGHGALAPSRIVVTPEGRLIIVEHVLGSALLEVSTSRLRAELGIAVPRSRVADQRFDFQTDYFQLGLTALSLLAGRQVSADESPDNVARLLYEVARTADHESPGLLRGLRLWLERALQLNGRVFESTAEAENELNGLSNPDAMRSSLQSRPLRAIPAPSDATRESASASRGAGSTYDARPEAPVLPDSVPHIQVVEPDEPESFPTFARHSNESSGFASQRPVSKQEEQPPVSHRSDDASSVVTPEASAPEAPVPDPAADVLSIPQFPSPGLAVQISEPEGSTVAAKPSLRKPQKKGRLGVLPSLAAVLALCVVVEGFVIGTLLQGGPAASGPFPILVETVDPGADVVVDGRSAGLTPLQLRVAAETRSIRVVDSRPPKPNTIVPAPAPRRSTPARRDVRASAAASVQPQRTGGMRLSSPFEVEVFEGNKRLGSSATGIISAAAGRRELELVNTRLGYRARKVVDVKGGEVVQVSVVPPNGRLSINALPWAEVWIDGKPVGETPLANLSVPLGEHEIVFRHPQLGERRQTALVRQDVVTRVSANLQR